VVVQSNRLNTDFQLPACGHGIACVDRQVEEREFELVIDTAGVPESMALAVGRAAVGATIVELGLARRPLELTAETLVRRQLVLRGSLTYDHPHDFRAAVILVASGAVAPGRVVSDVHPLAEAQRAFESAPSAPGKTWIRL
jgi:alcohol dehydrogenase/L-iditol 2-dehydrogenase